MYLCIRTLLLSVTVKGFQNRLAFGVYIYSGNLLGLILATAAFSTYSVEERQKEKGKKEMNE